MIKTIKPGQLVTYKNIVYRLKKAPTMLAACMKCDLWDQCPGCKQKFHCGWKTYFKRI